MAIQKGRFEVLHVVANFKKCLEDRSTFTLVEERLLYLDGALAIRICSA
jgi:hypothetical protein